MKRSEIDNINKWDVESVYTLDQIKLDRHQVKEYCQEILALKGVICLNVNNLNKVLDLENKLSILIEKLYVYFSHINDQDLGSAKASGDLLDISNFYHEISSQLSFVAVEILATDIDILNRYVGDQILNKHKKQLIELIESKKYILDDKSELILSKASDALSTSYDIYSTFVNAELTFDNVLDVDGNELPMNEASWSKYSQSFDIVLRRNAFLSLMNGYKKYKQTISTIYISYLKTQKFQTEIRGYDNPRFKALYNNQIDEKIYDNLINAIHENIDINHDYMKLRQSILKLDELNLHDVYVPLVNDVNTTFEYNNARDLVLESLEILGEEYLSEIKLAFSEKYIDVYPNDGKRGGAYSGGSYLMKPYILLNYTDTLNDVFTLTHELGHSMHSKFSNMNQDYQNSHYKIFVAEIASTVNELLLFNNMMSKDIDLSTKKYLLNYNLDQFRTTVYRQSMFAEFEYESSKLFFEGEMINEEILSNMYFDLNVKYFGSEVNINEEIKYEWLRIPHFYYNFYVYQYATSFCIATKIVSEILGGNLVMKKNYLEFLKTGDSVRPIEAIKKLNIDITTTKPLDDALKEYRLRLDELKQLIGE